MKNTAKHFALQLGSLISLYASIGALLALIFGVITIAYPDPANGYWEFDSASSSIRFSIAVLIVLFPTYLILTRLVQKGRRESKEEYLTLTKWLIYLSLLVAGAVLLGDLIAVINGFLNGELVTRFVLKALAVFVVVGAAFLYYLMDARDYWVSHERKSITYGSGALLFVAITIVVGYQHIDTPSAVREARLDDRQINDLQIIQNDVIQFYLTNEVLPETLTDVYKNRTIPTAPETRPAYTYTVTDADTFELCATFETETSFNNQGLREPVMFIDREPLKGAYSWDHGKGAWCFTRTVSTQEVKN